MGINLKARQEEIQRRKQEQQRYLAQQQQLHQQQMQNVTKGQNIINFGYIFLYTRRMYLLSKSHLLKSMGLGTVLVLSFWNTLLHIGHLENSTSGS